MPDNISDVPETDRDWENRRLCRDDSCIGTIGQDGRCRVCGLVDTGIQAPPPSDLPADVTDGKDAIQVQELSSEDHVPEPQDPAWEDRKLCRDDSCIGTIGQDGRCSVCGLAG